VWRGAGGGGGGGGRAISEGGRGSCAWEVGLRPLTRKLEVCEKNSVMPYAGVRSETGWVGGQVGAESKKKTNEGAENFSDERF